MSSKTKPSTLVFLVHGLRGSEKKISDLKLLLEDSYPRSVVRTPTYAHTSLFSTARATELVQKICGDIDEACSQGSFDRIILVGHSMGCVLARRVLIEASGTTHKWTGSETQASQREDAFTDMEKRLWAEKIERLIMFASISRGWSAEHTISPVQSFQWKLGGLIGHVMPERYRPTLFDFRRGSPFVVQTRLRWLKYCEEFPNRPQVVQFLGTQDNVAPPNDTIDFATAQGTDRFVQVELPHSDHSDMIRFSSYLENGSRQVTHTKKRRKIVQGVLRYNTEDFEQHVIKREWFLDELPAKLDVSTENLVFVIHGIRDRGYWTKKIAARIKEKAEGLKISFVSRTPSYGYFPILPFLLPWYRRQKVEWFMDQYVEAAAIHPKAEIHFLGHSNGTYLAARSLQDYPAVSFKRIFFAGSVVKRSYDWTSLVASGRVQKIFNVVATSDFVVALFPYGLRSLQKIFDLGGAGHTGFETPVPGALHQVDLSGYDNKREYVEGGHRAGREEELWNDIAEFFVSGDVIKAGSNNPHFSPKQPWLSQFAGRIAPVFVAALACLIIGLGVFVVWSTITKVGSEGIPDWVEPESALSSWFGLSVSTHMIFLGCYAAVLRFMALRF